MHENKPLVWFWRDPDSEWRNEVFNYINSVECSCKGTVILHCRDVKGFDESLPLSNYLLNIALKHKLLEDERSVFLNSKDLITAIELCLEQEKKQNQNSAIGIADEDIIQCLKAYQDHFATENGDLTNKAVFHLKKFLKEINCIDLCLLYDILSKCRNMQSITEWITDYKFLILGKPESYILKKAIYFINGNEEELQSIVVEVPKDVDRKENMCSASSLSKITTEALKLEDISLLNEKEAELGSATEEYVEDIILAFLSLLVNSRNELALSKAMISPVVNLSHQAFTELKHLAAEKDMPMCQVAISYVTRIKLGGKGYAPPADCPMLPHLKGLELFVDILNQIQTLIEEESVPESAIKKLINILKRKLLKSSGNLKADAIETGANNLVSTFLNASSSLKMKTESSRAPQICQETLDTLYSFINFVNCNYWNNDPEKILAKKQMKRTPLNLPPLLGYFRSPEDESSCDIQSTIDEDSNVSKISVVSSHASYFHNSDSSSVSVSCVDSTTPSKMNFKGCLKSEDVKVGVFKQSKPLEKGEKNPFSISKSRKRSILSEITNENFSREKEENNNKTSEKKQKCILAESKKTNKDLKKEKNGKKVPKKFKLIPGQGKITSFFINGKN